MNKFLTLSYFLIFTIALQAQTKFWEGGVFLGGSVMNCDLVNQNLGSFSDINPAFGVMARRYFHTNLAFRVNLLRSRLSADDRSFEKLAARGYRTETPLTELSMDFELDFLGHRRKATGVSKPSFSPYVYLGMGFAFTNPETTYTGTGGAEEIYDEFLEVSSTRFVVPVGAGLRVNMSPIWGFAAELGARATFSDYLDGVSQSGNPDKKDWYGFGSLQFWHQLTPPDQDDDGVADKNDDCPAVVGTTDAMGCPDQDWDGVPDYLDRCPEVAGIGVLGGCPDTDGDGIADLEDGCPTEAGSFSAKGCPDQDGDGISDKTDRCPERKGLEEYFGCPVQDSDKDGLLDNEDNCPYHKGPVDNAGCPYRDTDGDGLMDHEDSCPFVTGDLTLGGCPDTNPEIQKDAQYILNYASRNMRFATGRDEVVSNSIEILEAIIRVLNLYPQYSMKIEGYTDNLGTPEYNQVLSEERARKCYEYLIGRGIEAERLQYTGYGRAYPVANNFTAEGRAQNRRVEFYLLR